jgi:hypothetical protein
MMLSRYTDAGCAPKRHDVCYLKMKSSSCKHPKNSKCLLSQAENKTRVNDRDRLPWCAENDVSDFWSTLPVFKTFRSSYVNMVTVGDAWKRKVSCIRVATETWGRNFQLHWLMHWTWGSLKCWLILRLDWTLIHWRLV